MQHTSYNFLFFYHYELDLVDRTWLIFVLATSCIVLDEFIHDTYRYTLATGPWPRLRSLWHLHRMGWLCFDRQTNAFLLLYVCVNEFLLVLTHIILHIRIFWNVLLRLFSFEFRESLLFRKNLLFLIICRSIFLCLNYPSNFLIFVFSETPLDLSCRLKF